MPAIVPHECYNLGHNRIIVKACDWTRFINVPVCTITQLFQLIMIRDRVFTQFSVNVDGNVLNIDEVESSICRTISGRREGDRNISRRCQLLCRWTALAPSVYYYFRRDSL